MATITSSSSSSSAHLLHHFFRQSKVFFRPLSLSTFTHKTNQRLQPRFPSFLVSLNSPSISLSPSFSSLSISKSYSSLQEPDEENDDEGEVRLDPSPISLVQSEDLERCEEVSVANSVDKEEKRAKSRNLALKLSVKEKKELASYAHSLGKKLKCQLVGKSGVTDTVVFSFLETLEKNELLKVKIHRTCPGELEEVVQHLEEATGSVVVGQIGQTVILYRPSLTKLKAEEKRKESRRLFIKRTPPNSSVRKANPMRSNGRGRRGVSRVATP